MKIKKEAMERGGRELEDGRKFKLEAMERDDEVEDLGERKKRRVVIDLVD